MQSGLLSEARSSVPSQTTFITVIFLTVLFTRTVHTSYAHIAHLLHKLQIPAQDTHTHPTLPHTPGAEIYKEKSHWLDLRYMP